MSRSRAQAYSAIATGAPGYRLAHGDKYENVWQAMAAEDEKNGTAKIGRCGALGCMCGGVGEWV